MSNPNDPAFPGHEVWDDEKPDIGWIGGGLTKREILAAFLWRRETSSRQIKDADRPNERAREAVENAEALLAELAKRTE